MSDTSTVGEPERKAQLEEFYFQRRILFGCTLSLLLANILWIVAMSTNRWFIVSGGHGIFVESHRRFFKSSHTGIWRNCRYALVPQPVATSVVRNFTSLALPLEDLPKVKAQLRQEDFIKDFSKVVLPDLKTIEAVDESFRQHLFAQWTLKNDNSARFSELRERFHELTGKPHAVKKESLDPTDYEQVKNSISRLITDVEVNKTHELHVVVPHNLRQALFDGWEEKGYSFARLLYHYARSLEIDLNIYFNDTKYVFQPPPPPPKKKIFNGFTYNKWKRCTFTNLFADSDEEVIKADPSLDADILDYSRTAATFAIITVFVMVLGFIFTVYTFLNPRYMFKRLAGGIHFISGLTSATVCRVLQASVDHARNYLSYAFPAGATYTYGYGFYFGIIVAVINFISCIMFLWYSKKKKGSKAATEELGMADEPINIGR